MKSAITKANSSATSFSAAHSGAIKPGHPRHRARQTAAKLHRRAFAPGRSAQQVSDDSAQENQRRHAEGDAAPRLVDLLDDQVVAALDAPSGAMIKPADREPADRQQEKQPRMREACPRRHIERP